MSLIDLKGREGDRFKVKATPITRKYGIRAYQILGMGNGNDHVWPGEIGTWTVSHYIATDGAQMTVNRLEFSGGRSIRCESLSDYDAELLKRLPRPKSAAQRADPITD